MSSRNQEMKTHQTPSKQQESPVQETSQNQENPVEEASPNQENTQLLLPDSTKQEVVDAIFLTSLLGYKVSVGSLPSFDVDDHASTEGLKQLLDYVNADHDTGDCFDEALLRNKVLMLRGKYEKVVEERTEKADHAEDVSSDTEKLIFMLSERIWDPEYEDYGLSESNVDREVAGFGNREGMKDQDEGVMFLFPKSISEHEDDIATLVNLNLCSLTDERSLTDFINNNRNNMGRVNEAQLREKVLKLQTRYNRIVEERGKNLTDDDFPTYNEHLIFQLSRKVWGNEPRANVWPGI
ncbi:hypothetical protein POM88_015055 [Heracleum sosnowskyi]|uniref:Glabrous enhancer-binding protein-like DBD domain-containing protein n=1 Tax=Heracleum sosnowskyi TaxID=360622 RepID=A0AAD8IM34_9APIA|nr:hypothetical protein POM88_015055 [Heracleum sosnowskyi]